MGEQLHQRSSHIAAKILGPTTDFSTWGSSKGTENPQGFSDSDPQNPQGIWPNLKVRRTWLQNFHRTGESETLGGHKQNLVQTRTQEKGAMIPQETQPDLAVSVWESPVDAWVNSGLPWGQGHGQQQSWEPWYAGLSPSGGGRHHPTTAWPQAKLQGGNTAPPVNRKLD